MLNEKRPGIGMNRARASFLVNFTGPSATFARMSVIRSGRRTRSVNGEAAAPDQSDGPSVFVSLQSRGRRISLGTARPAGMRFTKTNIGEVRACQIERHLKSVGEGEKLLAITPDNDRPAVLDQPECRQDRVVWSNFDSLAEAIEAILGDVDDPPTERERFLLRELIAMLQSDGLLSAGPMVAIVAANSGWPMYQAVPAYRCALTLPLRSAGQMDYLGFTPTARSSA